MWITQKIKEKNHIPIQVQRLFFSGQQLENHHTLDHYSIKKNSTVPLLLRLNGGIVACEEPTNDSNDNKATTLPIKAGHIPSPFISNTNESCIWKSNGGDVYAVAACSAYINTILRIPGARSPPSFSECMNIARYNGSDGGDPIEPLKRLEKSFKFGIDFMRQNNLSIKEAPSKHLKDKKNYKS